MKYLQRIPLAAIGYIALVVALVVGLNMTISPTQPERTLAQNESSCISVMIQLSESDLGKVETDYFQKVSTGVYAIKYTFEDDSYLDTFCVVLGDPNDPLFYPHVPIEMALNLASGEES